MPGQAKERMRRAGGKEHPNQIEYCRVRLQCKGYGAAKQVRGDNDDRTCDRGEIDFIVVPPIMPL
jgi:hypothetical protein